MGTKLKIDKLRERFYAGRISKASFYRRVAALIMMDERREVIHIH